MKAVLRYGLAVVVLMSTLSSCTLLQYRPMSSGEMRLVSVKTPDIVNENMPYDIVVTFLCDGEPQIKEVCFHWAIDKANVPAPSLYMFTREVQSDQRMEPMGSRWIEQGTYTQIPASFCSAAEKVSYGDRGTFTARIQTGSLDLQYNRLECRVKYVQDGSLKETNKIVGRVVIDK